MPIEGIEGVGGAVLAFFIQYPVLKFFGLGLAALIEGPIVTMAAGFFVHLGYLPLVWTLVAVAVGEIVGDIFWYYMGLHYGERATKRFGPWFGLTHEHIEQAKGLFYRYHTAILLISKLSMGFGLAIPILFTAGLTRVKFSWFMFISVVGQFVWSAFLMTVGYYVGELFFRIDDVFGRVSLGVTLVVIVVALFFLARQMKRRFFPDPKP